MSDPVNHPKHYTSHPSGIECIQVTEHFGFNIGNAIKYLWRAEEKGAPIQDLKKAAWYINREIEKRAMDPVKVAIDEFHDACMELGSDSVYGADVKQAEEKVAWKREVLNAAIAARLRREPPAAPAPEAVSYGHAPARIWLNHGADEPAEMTAEEWQSGEVSWCWENIHGNDVPYVRADLALLPASPKEGPAPEVEAAYRDGFYAGAESQGWSDASGCDPNIGKALEKAWSARASRTPAHGGER